VGRVLPALGLDDGDGNEGSQLEQREDGRSLGWNVAVGAAQG
jgi:hypothetical protein